VYPKEKATIFAFFSVACVLFSLKKIQAIMAYQKLKRDKN